MNRNIFYKIVVAFTLLFQSLSYSQNDVTVPSFAPPSPQAYEMTKFGDVPVNEFTGMINTSIPLYTYKSGNLQLPISLSYAGNGIRVDQSPTWTGINWVLNASGVITRTINGVADERALYRSFILDSTNDAGADGTAVATNFSSIDGNPNKEYDKEADVFNFSFNGFSGSFYLDNTMQPMLIKNDSELKITITGNNLLANKEIVISTPDGVKYFFGGTNAVETNVEGNIHLGNSTPEGITAFYLTKILHPINGEILFEYDTLAATINDIARSENFGVLTSTTFVSFVYYSGVPPTPKTCKYNVGPPESAPLTRILQWVTNARFLKKIYSPTSNETVNFLTENTIIVNSWKILKNINIKNGLNTIKEIELKYLNADTTNKLSRFFLEKVWINKNLSLQNNIGQNKFEEFRMEYNDPLGLPNRFSFGQDYWGYFNGITTNISTIPKLENTVFNTDVYYNSFAANRKPNFNFASKGVLTKIYYPTKGSTFFEYETNPVLEKNIEPFSGYVILSNQGSDLTENAIPRPNNLSVNSSLINFNPVFETQTVNVNISMLANLGFDCYGPNHMIHSVTTIQDLTTNAPATTFNRGLGYTGVSIPFPFTFVKDHNYQMNISILNTQSQSFGAGCEITATYSFNLCTGYKIGAGKGIRIKRVTDFKTNSDVASIKRFYYMPLKKIARPVWEQNIPFISTPVMITKSMVNVKVPCAPGYYADQFYYSYLSSNSVANCFSNYNSRENNHIVTISYGGDNFENGGKEKYFEIFYNNLGQNFSSLTPSENYIDVIGIATNSFTSNTDNLSTLSGNVTCEIDFIKKGPSFFKQKQTESFFEQNIPYDKYFINYVSKKVFNVFSYSNGIQPGTTSSNFFFKKFKTYSFKRNLNSTKTTEYLQDCEMQDYDYSSLENPIQIPDIAGIKKRITTQTYTYGNLRGLPTQISTTTSDSSKSKITKNIYADQAITLTGLSAPQLVNANTLVEQNNVAAPMQVEQYLNSDLLSKQRTVFKTGAVPTQILPDVIQTAKGTANLEDRVVFLEYDPKGNPSIVMMKDGSKTKYFYNNDNQVIIKIENYTGASNVFANPMGTTAACTFINQYPTSMVSVYNYDAVNKQITSIVAPDCKTSFYEYNALNQLYQIKDQLGNILQEFDHNYKN